MGLPRVMSVVVVLGALMWYLLGHSPYGRALYAMGSNPRAANLVGIRVRRNLLLTFVIAGALAGIAGVLQTARVGGATADSGTSLLFPALAAVFLGATAIEPGRFNVLGTMIGVVFVSETVSGLTLAGAVPVTGSTWCRAPAGRGPVHLFRAQAGRRSRRPARWFRRLAGYGGRQRRCQGRAAG
ncbi:ABC transporter permease [Streptomyces sp. NPDC001401]|uniref:ABC transporter permease n=1 Tax=Streptomyces sp. NPDC001401 TaxID=3364570 RepID=UPI003699F2E6